MTMKRANFQSLLFEGLREVFFNALKEKDMIYKGIYDVRSSKKERETDQSIVGVGMLDLKEEGVGITYDDFTEGYSVDYIHDTFAKGIRITEEMMEDDLYSVMNKRAQALARSARYRMEYDHASLFNYANATTIFTGGDGKALIASDHPLAGSMGSTYSNLSTSDLSLSALESATTIFRKMQDDNGLLVNITPKTLLVPPELEFDAYEILNSSGKPYTGDNEQNYFKGRFNVVVWDFLTDTDSWFLLADKSDGAPISFERVPISFKEDGDFDTGDLKIKARCRYSFGFPDWRWICGSMGAG